MGVKCSTSKSGQHIIAGAGELHLEICLKDLKEDYMKGADIRVSEPVVSFGETVGVRTGYDEKHPAICVSKSPNKHNRLYMYAEPLEDEFIKAVDEDEITLPNQAEMKKFGRNLADNFGWDIGEARKIWTFGCPPDAKANCVVDVTKGVQFLNEIKDHVVGAFMQVTTGGILCDEVMRGCKFCITDVKLHADTIHRGAGQIMPCAKKVFSACQLASCPKLLEPMFLVDITVPQNAQSGVFNTLNTKRGEDRHSAVAGPGLPARHRVVWLHRTATQKHGRAGLPADEVQPLEDGQRRPVQGRLHGQRPPQGHSQEEGHEGGTPRLWRLL